MMRGDLAAAVKGSRESRGDEDDMSSGRTDIWMTSGWGQFQIDAADAETAVRQARAKIADMGYSLRLLRSCQGTADLS